MLVLKQSMMKYECIQLTDIDLSTLKLVKGVVTWFDDQDHSRWICRTSKYNPLDDIGAAYLKIWNPTYIRRDNILRAIAAGFYDESTTPALKALIFHKGICRGYVMAPCQASKKLDPGFYELIKRKTAHSRYFHVQFSRYHVFKFNNTFSLIDLEGVHPLCDLPRLPELHCVFDYPHYEQFVTCLFWENFGHKQAEFQYPLLSSQTTADHPAWHIPLLHKPFALYSSWRRQLIIKWRTFRHNMHLIER